MDKHQQHIQSAKRFQPAFFGGGSIPREIQLSLPIILVPGMWGCALLYTWELLSRTRNHPPLLLLVGCCLFLRLRHLTQVTIYPFLTPWHLRYWSSKLTSTMACDTKAFVSAYSVCVYSKLSYRLPVGQLHHLPIPHQPWSHIALGFVIGLPLSSGNKNCRLTGTPCLPQDPPGYCVRP